MKKQTKNVITREWVEKELRFYNTADIRSTLVLSGSLALLFVPLTVLCVFGIVAVVDNLPLEIVLGVLLGVIVSCPVWGNLLALIGSLSERKLLSKGEFDITCRELRYKCEKIVARHTERFLEFRGFSDISVGSGVYEMSSAGDEFYIVYYRTKSSIKLLYPVKIYEYKES